MKILIINGHPDKKSFCFALAERYKIGVDSLNVECNLINLIDLKFNPVLTSGYREESTLEPDLIMMQEEISTADHILFVYPNWWGTYPALLKGFFDRVFLPNFAFKFVANSPLPKQLLQGISARLIITMDTPKWYYWLVLRNAGHRTMKTGILGFCGIKPVSISTFTVVKSSSEIQRKKWLSEVEELGKLDASQ